LLLADDKEPITIRINALANWCAGFLSGLGQFGFASKQVKSAEITEFLDDLLQISQVKDKGKPGTEGDEKDYTELVEYVRIGVLMLYTHCT
jgi:hypothetical protein